MTADVWGINPAAPWWKRMLFLHGPHCVARRLRVLRALTEDEARDKRSGIK